MTNTKQLPPEMVQYYYLQCGRQITTTWYACTTKTVMIMDGFPKPQCHPTDFKEHELIKEITVDEKLAYDKLIEDNIHTCVLAYNGTAIKLIDISDIYVTVILNGNIAPNLFCCGMFFGFGVMTDNPSKIWDQIWVGKEQFEGYQRICGKDGYLQYNSATKEFTPINTPYCTLVLWDQINETTFHVMPFSSRPFDGLVPPSKSGDAFLISYEDYNKYQAIIHAGNKITYDLQTKKITIEEPAPVLLSVQAKPLYEDTLATYGSGYLWNKLTKAQQKELSTYLDALDAIIKDEAQSADELPIKPDFLP